RPKPPVDAVADQPEEQNRPDERVPCAGRRPGLLGSVLQRFSRALQERVLVCHDKRPLSAALAGQYSIPCEEFHLVHFRVGQMRPMERPLRRTVPGQRKAAEMPAAPSVRADDSATSNSSRGYSPSTSVAATASPSTNASAGVLVGSDPIVSFFRYMNTTMRT